MKIFFGVSWGPVHLGPFRGLLLAYCSHIWSNLWTKCSQPLNKNKAAHTRSNRWTECSQPNKSKAGHTSPTVGASACNPPNKPKSCPSSVQPLDRVATRKQTQSYPHSVQPLDRVPLTCKQKLKLPTLGRTVGPSARNQTNLKLATQVQPLERALAIPQTNPKAAHLRSNRWTVSQPANKPKATHTRSNRWIECP